MNRGKEYLDERWKERASQIRELDKHKCAMCGASGVVLDVHHLSYPPPPFHIWDSEDDELVTLCRFCHEVVHISHKRPYLTWDRLLKGVTTYCLHRDECKRYKKWKDCDGYMEFNDNDCFIRDFKETNIQAQKEMITFTPTKKLPKVSFKHFVKNNF